MPLINIAFLTIVVAAFVVFGLALGWGSRATERLAETRKPLAH